MAKCSNSENECEKAIYECEECESKYCQECASNSDYECDCIELPKLIKIKKK